MRIPLFGNTSVPSAKTWIVQKLRNSLTLATRAPVTPGNILARAVAAARMHATTPANHGISHTMRLIHGHDHHAPGVTLMLVRA